MPIRHAGQYFDSEVGVFYNYFRDYDPATGRYVQSDPIGLDGGLNTYGYVKANPLIYIDPKGENFGAVIGGGFAAWGIWKYYQYIECVEKCPVSCDDGDTEENMKCKMVCLRDLLGLFMMAPLNK